MNWWEWVFSGIGVLILGLLLEWWRRRSRPSGDDAALTAQGAKVSDSPVASGSGITQVVTATHHHYYGQTEAAAETQSAAPTPPPPELVRIPREEASPSSRVIVTATRVIYVTQTGQSKWSEGRPNFDYEAIVIQFTNEAAPGYRNSQPLLRPSLVYSDEQNNELLRITGGWVNEETDLAHFRLEESHNLLVGVLLGGQLTGFEYTRTPSAGGGEYCHMIRRTLQGFRQGTVRVRLTDIHSRTLLYEGYYDIAINPLRIGPRQRTT
jgi:hypothetical protein